MKRHAGLVALIAVVAPLAAMFCWHDVIASIGDDSLSYVALARHLSPFSGDALVEPWVRYYSHFPPVFPLLLAFTGGAWNFLAAHMLVAACAVFAAAMVCICGAMRLGSERAGLGAAVVFLLLPTAWVSILGILTEPLYLALSLAALAWHERHPEGRNTRDALVLGLLIAAACMTRVAGVALIAAYVAHVVIGVIVRRERPAMRAFLPIAIPVAFQLLWWILRPPLQSRGYQMDLQAILGNWFTDTGRVATISWNSLSGAWVSSFAGDSSEPLWRRIAFAAICVAGFAGAVRGAMRNRLDSWYTLATGAMLVLWVFNEDNQRRLLYPLVPLLLVHAAEMLEALVQRFKDVVRPSLAMPAAAAFVVALSAPATLLVFQKSLDRVPYIAGYGYSPAAITDYYTTVNVTTARGVAWRLAAVLAGLESIGRETPPGSRVMWVRPEYIAILGKREAVPWYYSWDRATLAREIKRTGTTHVVAARLFKSDLAGSQGDAFAAFAIDTPAYLRAVSKIADPAGTEEFVLLKVDTQELERAIAR